MFIPKKGRAGIQEGEAPKPTVSYKKKGPPAVMTRGPLKEVYIS